MWNMQKRVLHFRRIDITWDRSHCLSAEFATGSSGGKCPWKATSPLTTLTEKNPSGAPSAQSLTSLCRFCAEKFTLTENRRSYERRRHDPNRKRELECPLCPKLFYDNNAVKTHLLTHTGDKVHKCGECGKEFVTTGELRGHLNLVHAGNRPFECGICGESFKVHATLKRHREARPPRKEL